METPGRLRLQDHFSQGEDPRVERTKADEWRDIIVIAVCAVICGADDWVEIAAWGEETLEWLRQKWQFRTGSYRTTRLAGYWA